MDLLINESKIEVARTITQAINLWLKKPEYPVTVYVTEEGQTDYGQFSEPRNACLYYPTGYKATLTVIDSWTFGERDSNEDQLSDDEASSIIYQFGYDWAIDDVSDLNQDYERVIYLESY